MNQKSKMIVIGIGTVVVVAAAIPAIPFTLASATVGAYLTFLVKMTK